MTFHEGAVHEFFEASSPVTSLAARTFQCSFDMLRH